LQADAAGVLADRPKVAEARKRVVIVVKRMMASVIERVCVIAVLGLFLNGRSMAYDYQVLRPMSQVLKVFLLEAESKCLGLVHNC
jgi:hypothetical protein